jgi:hypothetical protein
MALVCRLFADSAEVNGFQATLARSGVAIAAIRLPAGFFPDDRTVAAGSDLDERTDRPIEGFARVRVDAPQVPGASGPMAPFGSGVRGRS